MEANNLSLEEINPKEAELRQLAADYGSLAINGIEDKEGYDRVHEARMVLRAKRVEVEKKAKLFREDAIQRQKAIIALEKSLVAIIEPLEDKLHAMEKEIDEKIEMENRRALLPDRHAKLAEIEVVASDELLLSMTPERFQEFFNAEKEAWLNKREAAMRQAQEAADAAKKAEQDAKDAEAREAKRKADEEARIEAAKKETEERIRREAQEKADREAREKKEAEERAAKEQAELESKKKYLNWLKKHDALTPENKLATGFVIQQNGKVLALYKHVETITL